MTQHQGSYYVPSHSVLPICTAFGLFLLGLGSIYLIPPTLIGQIFFGAGVIIILSVLVVWFRETIREGKAGLHNAQMERSYRWGMFWFIFADFMLFAFFFFALFYLRLFSITDLGGQGGTLQSVTTHVLLWPNFTSGWPLITTPNPVAYPGPRAVFQTWMIPALLTLILLASSISITWAHWALKRNLRKQLLIGVGITLLLGLGFLVLQTLDFYRAINAYEFTLTSGIYGNTFFMLTGIHFFHVIVGLIILSVIWVRCFLGHFTPNNHFGFEAATWYWQFIDAMWLCLFILVYWI